MSTILSIENLCRSFGGVAALKNINMTFEAQQLKSIIGPNGAGKTTLINVITGLIPTTSGRVFYQDVDITNESPHKLVKMGICRTFQITSIFPKLAVFENVRIAKQLQRGGSSKVLSSKNGLKKINEETRAILEDLGLCEKAHLLAVNLSHGDQRLLEVAIALAGQAKLLFLDEPTAGMSSGETENISALIRRLTNRISIVMVEHDMDMVMKISDRIVVLNQGEIIAEGTPEEIQLNAKVRDAYLGKE